MILTRSYTTWSTRLARCSAVLTVLLVVAPPSSLAAEAEADAEDCSALTDANARLACFDRMFPRRNAASPQDTGSGPVAQPPVEQTTEPPVASKVAKPERKRRGFGFPKIGDLFSSGPDESVESRIARVRANDRQKMVFLLENDQIWIQDSPRLVRIRE